MALIPQSVIERLELLRAGGTESTSYKSGYQYAARGLESAINLLKQVQEQTKGYSIDLTKKD